MQNSETSFPAQLLSGTLANPASGFISGNICLYSWKENAIDPLTGNWAEQPSPRFGVANARERNNANLLSGSYFPFYTHLDYEGSVSGGPFRSFNAGVIAPDTDTTLTLKNGITVIDAACQSLAADDRSILTFSHLASNSDQVVVAAASPTQYGVVTTIAQEFAGAKTFDDLADFKSGWQAEASCFITTTAVDHQSALTINAEGNQTGATITVADATAVPLRLYSAGGPAIDIDPGSGPSSGTSATVLQWRDSEGTDGPTISIYEKVSSDGVYYDAVLAAHKTGGGPMLRLADSAGLLPDGSGNPTFDGVCFTSIFGFPPAIGLGGSLGGEPRYKGKTATITVVTGVDFTAGTVTTETLTFVSGILTDETSGSGSGSGGGGGSGSGGDGPEFDNLCPGKTFNSTYSLTISGTCTALNGTYSIVWNNSTFNWTWTGTVSGQSITFNLHDTGGTPSPGVTLTMNGDGSGGGSASSTFTCPPTLAASGSFTIVSGSALCSGETINWSVS